ncbi:hypothetical protein ACJX0J_012251, partial [Zea mays]
EQAYDFYLHIHKGKKCNMNNRKIQEGSNMLRKNIAKAQRKDMIYFPSPEIESHTLALVLKIDAAAADIFSSTIFSVSGILFLEFWALFLFLGAHTQFWTLILFLGAHTLILFLGLNIKSESNKDIDRNS